jgi:hypothetical protein
MNVLRRASPLNRFHDHFFLNATWGISTGSEWWVLRKLIHICLLVLDGRFLRRHRQRFGRARRRSFERPFKYKKEERRNALNYLNRDGQFLVVNGQFVVLNGQKTVANLVE